jgi:solute carrier family 25 thiamine pyrophosphate transporter 19
MSRRKKKEQQADDKAPARSPLEVKNAPLLTACSGALAGAVARFVVGPLDVVKIRFQVQLEPIAAGAAPSKYTSMRQALVTIVKEEGIKVRLNDGITRCAFPKAPVTTQPFCCRHPLLLSDT